LVGGGQKINKKDIRHTSVAKGIETWGGSTHASHGEKRVDAQLDRNEPPLFCQEGGGTFKRHWWGGKVNNQKGGEGLKGTNAKRA